MSNNFEILLSAQNRATAEIMKLQKQLDDLGKHVNQAQKRTSEWAAKSTNSLRNLGKGFGSVTNQAQKAANSIASMVPGIAVLTGAGTIAGMSAIVERFSSLGFNLNKTSGLLGINTKSLQEWHIAGQRAGITASEMDSGLASMQSSIRAAGLGQNAAGASALATMHVDIIKGKNGLIDYEKTYEAVLKGLAKEKNPQAQKAMAEALGMSAFLPMIQRGKWDQDKSEASNRGWGMTDEMIARAASMKNSIDTLENSIMSTVNTIADRLTPVLQPVVEELARWFDANKQQVAESITNAVESFVKWIKSVDWSAVSKDFSNFFDAIGGIKGAMIGIAAISFAGPIAGLMSIGANLLKIATMLGSAALSTFFGIEGAGAVAGAVAGGAVAAGVVATGLAVGYVGNAALESDRKYHAEHPELKGTSLKDRQTHLKSAPDKAGDFVAYFESQGWTHAQAAGIVGNLMQESGLNAHAQNASGMYGLAQWDTARRANFAKRYGHDIQHSTEAEQLEHIHYELTQGSEQKAGQQLKQTRTAADAALAVDQYYERSGGAEAGSRMRYAEQAAAAQPIHIVVNNAQPGTRVETKTPDGSQVPAKINYAMAGAF